MSPGLQSDLLAPGDPRWLEALEQVPHDLYHLPGFVTFASRWHANGEPRAFVARHDDALFLVPLIVREIPREIAGDPGWLDATGPRGYPGPIVNGAGEDAGGGFLDDAVGALTEELRQRRIVSAFIRCHPLLTPPADALRRHGDVVEHGESVSIDLARSEAETWAGYRANHRRSIRRARQAGYRSRLDAAWERLPEFLAIYELAMERLGAEAHWRLSESYLLDFRRALDGGLHLWIVELDGALAAGALISEIDGTVEYHLAATAADHAGASPSKLLIDDVGRWARDRGDRVLHLAGSLRHDDALIHFKRGFSPLRHQVSSWRLITDPGAYRTLAERRGRVPANDDDPGFFPAYRRPA